MPDYETSTVSEDPTAWRGEAAERDPFRFHLGSSYLDDELWRVTSTHGIFKYQRQHDFFTFEAAARKAAEVWADAGHTDIEVVKMTPLDSGERTSGD